MGRSGKTKRPASLDCSVRVRPVAGLATVTAAAGMEAPVLSATVPRMLPVDCAAEQAGGAEEEGEREEAEGLAEGGE